MNVANKPVKGLNIEMKPVAGYDDLYAGVDGFLYKKISNGFYRYTGYLTDGYYKTGARIVRGTPVHRLVYLAWFGPIPNGCEIDHLNGVKTDISNINPLLLFEHAHSFASSKFSVQ